MSSPVVRNGAVSCSRYRTTEHARYRGGWQQQQRKMGPFITKAEGGEGVAGVDWLLLRLRRYLEYVAAVDTMAALLAWLDGVVARMRKQLVEMTQRHASIA